MKDPNRPRCQYFMPHKHNRQCNMTRKATDKFCAQHSNVDLQKPDNNGHNHKHNARVKCPLDPSHSVWLKDISRHMSRCPAAKTIPTEPWFASDCNLLRPEPSLADTPISYEEYHKWVAYVTEFYTRNIAGSSFERLPLKQILHDGVTSRLDQLSNQKHAIQQASLIAILDSVNLLEPKYSFIEFGAGRAELSRALLHKHSPPDHNPSFILVDRSGTRMKLDSKVVKDWQDREPPKFSVAPHVRRVKIDIKDLRLNDPELLKENREIVAVSKHLCGAATDLTLNCLNASPDRSVPVAGIMIALCCRHRCSYSSYPLQYIDPDNTIDPRGFQILCKMTSWAICGRRFNAGKTNSSDADDEDNQEDAPAHVSKLPVSHREEIGYKARAMLDYGRVKYLEHLGFKVELMHYVEKSVSSENVCLLATKQQAIN